MAVFTHITDDEMKNFLASNYDLGDFFRIAALQSGTQSTNYWLRTSKGEFVFTIFEQGEEMEHVEKVYKFVNYLAQQKQMPYAEIFSTQDNQQISSYDDKPTIVARFMHGYTLSARNITRSHCIDAGKALAKMHEQSESYKTPIESVYNKKNWPDILSFIKAHMRNLTPRQQDKFLILQKNYKDLLESWPKGKEKLNIHGDLFPDNVLFIDDSLSGLIDLNFTDFENPIYDLSMSLIGWCFDHNNDFNIDLFMAFAKSYAENSKFWTVEAIMDLNFYLQAAALRFVLSRFYDVTRQHVPQNKEILDPFLMTERYNFLLKNGQSLIHKLINEVSTA